MSLAPGTPVGRYVIRRKLAEGGMAEIFLAQSHGPEGFEKQVVIKRIRSALADDPSFVQMFIAEARVASRLNHANVVHIFDFDRHEDSYYLAMEYVRGKTLAELHRRVRNLNRPFPPVLAAQISLEVARGLAYAHRLTEHGQSLGLVHRDVTPHNVLISFEGAVKLTDFGIAKASNRASTAGMLKGKFAYMSPEQSRGDPVDSRTDLFALGITLWELLTGARLFDGDSDVAVLRAVQEREIVSPSKVTPAVDPALAEVVMTALQRDPTRRFQSAGDLERKLLTYVIGAPRAPEDTDVGLFIRSLFPEEASREEESDPVGPLQLVSGVGPTVSGPRSGGASVGLRDTRAEGRLLQKTAPSGSVAPVLEEEALAPTRTPVGRRASAATAPGRQSVVTQAPADEMRMLAAQIGARRRRMVLAVVGLAVVLGVGGIAFVAGRTDSGLDVGRGPVAAVPSAPTQPVTAPVPPPPAVEARAPVPPQPPQAVAPPAAPGFLVVKAQPWGKLYVDGKYVTDVEGVRRFPLAPGSHILRLVNGKKAHPWTVEIESGKTVTREHSFLED
ncbi:MAG TPA: serine/threonine-protein kinase [Myxococcaceae bacterium]|nr:serine/threonine-protein kinase [Myxococcaceae bacterium]